MCLQNISMPCRLFAGCHKLWRSGCLCPYISSGGETDVYPLPFKMNELQVEVKVGQYWQAIQYQYNARPLVLQYQYQCNTRMFIFDLIGPSDCVRYHGTKCPLLIALFLISPPGYFSPKMSYRRFPKFCMGF